tara:strand:- start:152 stop:367 length:216 start_codon:yes stop_codon:yes gene_type:complete
MQSKEEVPLPWEAMDIPDYLIYDYYRYLNNHKQESQYKQEAIYAPAPMPPLEARRKESNGTDERKVIIVEL